MRALKGLSREVLAAIPLGQVTLDMWRAMLRERGIIRMPEIQPTAQKPKLTMEDALLARGQAELQAARDHRHWLSGTMPHDQLIEQCKTIVDAIEERATAPAEQKKERPTNA